MAKIEGIENNSGTERHESSLRPAQKVGKRSFRNTLESAFKEIGGKPAALKKSLLKNDSPTVASYQNQTSDAGFKSILAMVLKHEGRAYVKNDAQKGPSRMGILQSTAREYGYYGNIKNITQAQTEAIYKKIWDKSGAASLPYPLSAIHFDTYVNSPAAAKKILKQSGGDIETYLALRAERYSKLASIRPDRYARYLKGWMNRIDSLREMANAYAKASESTTRKIV